jgi:predicted acyltransferase (DUF342 family)
MGKHSLATGFRTTASGEHSTASGYMSTASGRGSTAIGNNTTASDYGSFVIGQYNDALSSVTTNGGATAYNADNTAFVIGNGTAPDNKSDAFKVLFNGDATIGKDLSINGKLIIDGKELKLSSDKIDKLNGGILSSVKENNIEGFRLSAYPDTNYGNIGEKAVDLSYSDTKSNTQGAMGKHSLATGLNTTASGEHSTAMGYNTTASDHGSFVIGQYNDALSLVTTDGSADQYNANNTAFVIGNGTAPDNKSDAFKVAYNGDATIGKDLTIKGNTSIGNNLSIKKDLTIYGKLIIKGKEVDSENIEKLELLDGGTLSSKLTADGKGFGFRLSTYLDTNYGNIGDKAVDLSYSDTESDTNGASGKYSLATGLNTTASGIYSLATGLNTTASGSYSTATGIYSTAMGKNTTASDHGSFVIGQYNDALSEVTTGGFSGQYDTDNTAFVIGNGFVDENNNTVIRSDAFKVGYNGDATIGNDLRVIGDVFISSDVRLKTNIVSLGSTLSKLLLIDGKSFTMKKNGKQKIGVIAQDIQKVFPELVRKDDNEMLAVNYQGLIPILINALKEQNAKISRLEHLIKIKYYEKINCNDSACYYI